MHGCLCEWSFGSLWDGDGGWPFFLSCIIFKN